MGDPRLFGISEKMPAAYYKVLIDNFQLISSLFPYDDLGKEAQVKMQLLHFMDVYIEVFNYSAKQNLSSSAVYKGDSPVIRECVTKFRENFRQTFRAQQYFPLEKFDKLKEIAMKETADFYNALPNCSLKERGELNKILAEEVDWLTKINQHRRKEVLENVKEECMESFRKILRSTYKPLYNSAKEDENTFWGETELFGKLHNLRCTAVEDYKQKIPLQTEELPGTIFALCREFEKDLNKILDDIKTLNSNRKSLTEGFMNAVVKSCTEKYSKAMEPFLKDHSNLDTDREQIFNRHKTLVQENMPKFTKFVNGKEAEVGTKLNQAQCRNNYQKLTHETFEKLLENHNKTESQKLERCKTEMNEEMQPALENVAKILKKYGLDAHANDFRDYVDNGLKNFITNLTETNKVNAGALVESAKPIPMSPTTTDSSGTPAPDYSTHYEAYKKIYLEKLKELLKNLNATNDKNSKLQAVNTAHIHAKEYVKYLLEAERPIWGSTKTNMILQTVTEFADLINDNTGNILKHELVVKPTGKPVRFSLVLGQDRSVDKNGTVTEYQTNYHCITAMEEYKNLSLEELRWEHYCMSKQSQDPLQAVIMAEKLDPITGLNALFKGLSFPEKLANRSAAKFSGTTAFPPDGNSGFTSTMGGHTMFFNSSSRGSPSTRPGNRFRRGSYRK